MIITHQTHSELCSRGGFSFCYLAEDKLNSQLPHAALKIGGVLSSQDQHDWAWTGFCQEMRIFRQLSIAEGVGSADCIPNIYGSGIVDTAEGMRPWICMEVCPV